MECSPKMLKSLIVLSDSPDLGHAMQGGLLYDFLRAYFSADEVRAITLHELRSLKDVNTELLFIALPTSLKKDDLCGVQFRQAAVFDYHDHDAPRWGDSDRNFLLTLTNLYLRCYKTSKTFPDVRLGLLPLHRKPNLGRAIRARQLWHRTLRLPIRQFYDVNFVGAPTELRLERNGERIRYHQRIEWLREVTSRECGLSFWGGLACGSQTKNRIPELESRYGDLQSIMFPKRRTEFFRYFYNLCRSRVALAPAGYSRWSFRHYEAVYAGTAVVSTEMRDVEMLIPLPREGMYFVPDHAPVLPVVRQAVEEHRRHPEKFEQNIDFLETYLRNGRYSSLRPLLLERFMSQLDDSVNSTEFPGQNGRSRVA